MQPREAKDAKTVAIVRALAIFALVFGVTVAAATYALHLADAEPTDGVTVVLAGVAALASIAWLRRGR